MAYATATTLLIYLPGLPSSSTAEGYTSTLEIMSNTVIRATDITNGYVISRYDVSSFNTAGSVPPLLKTITEDIAAYYTMRSLYSGDNQNLNEWIEKYQESMELLQKIRESDMDLFDTAGNLIPDRETGSNTRLVDSNTRAYNPTFGEDSSTSWNVDENKLDALGDTRD